MVIREDEDDVGRWRLRARREQRDARQSEQVSETEGRDQDAQPRVTKA
jgi:hypothetical protein